MQAHMTVIPKPGEKKKKKRRDSSTASNFRPISLLEVVMKIYKNVLANRLTLLPRLVLLDQVGFIPDRGQGKYPESH